MMGLPIMILGESGSGKSTSLRNFEPDELGIFNVAGKPLPFRKKLPSVNNPGYGKIIQALSRPTKRCYVIDDSQYLMAFASFDRAKETGYGKFTDLAVDFRNLIQFIIAQTPPDVLVYFLHHTETADTGKVKAKTIGKMLDSQLTVEGLFSIVLLCEASKDSHHFVTQSDGFTTCKSPMGMFEDSIIDNDLRMVDTTIREYWGLKPITDKTGKEEKANG